MGRLAVAAGLFFGLVEGVLLQVQGGSLLRGHVRSAAGVPIQGVEVSGGEGKCCSITRSRTVSLSDGSFELSDPNGVVYFRKEGFAPAAKVLNPQDRDIKITLESATETNWSIPPCPDSEKHGERAGGELRFRIPRKAKVKKGFDTDYAYWRVRAPDGSSGMSIMSGPLVGGGQPDDRWTLNSSEYKERWIVGSDGRHSGHIGMDARGLSKDGRRFRSAGISSDTAFYFGASKDAAVFFDRIIDSACYRFTKYE